MRCIFIPSRRLSKLLTSFTNLEPVLEAVDPFPRFKFSHSGFNPLRKVVTEPGLKIIGEPDRARLEESIGRRPRCGSGINTAARPFFSARNKKATASKQTEIANAVKNQVCVDVSCREFVVFA